MCHVSHKYSHARFHNFLLIFWRYCTAKLHTWKLAQLLLGLIFSIGNDSLILPDHNNWRADSASTPVTETPAKVVLRALVSALEVHWYLEKRQATLWELDVFHVVLRNAAINANLLNRLKQFVLNRKKKPKRLSKLYPVLKASEITIHHFYYGGVKFHYMTFFACFQRLFGLHGSGKDTEKTESFHKQSVKAPMKSISNHSGNRLLECAKEMQKNAHAACMMEKIKATQQEAEDDSDVSFADDERDDITKRKRFRSQCFKNTRIVVGRSTFTGLDAGFKGSPYLHPIVSLGILFAAFLEHLNVLEDTAVETSELSFLRQALGENPDQSYHCTRNFSWTLVEGLKLSSDLQCGDLMTAEGKFFIRSTRQFKDDRKGAIAERTFHPEHSFVFVQSCLAKSAKLVRVLGVIVCRDVVSYRSEDFFIGVTLSRARDGYLPFDRYDYSFVRVNESEGYPDIEIFNCKDIASPAWCVPVNPLNFTSLHDPITSKNYHYCIPPSRVLCNAQQYEDLLGLNTKHLNPFRNVSDLNILNTVLEGDVDAFNLTARAVAEKKKAALLEMVKAKRKIGDKSDGYIKEKKSKTTKKKRKTGGKQCSESDEADKGLFFNGKSKK